MIHVQNEATAMVKEWKKNGFNGVRFIECYMESTRWDDWEGDGRSRSEYDAFVEGYAIFVAHPDLHSYYEPRNEYESVSVSWWDFQRDLLAEIKRRLGDDVEITFHEGCNEYECQRTGQQSVDRQSG